MFRFLNPKMKIIPNFVMTTAFLSTTPMVQSPNHYVPFQSGTPTTQQSSLKYNHQCLIHLPRAWMTAAGQQWTGWASPSS